MRLNEILTEQQINEISWKDVAKGAGIAVGATAKGVGSGIKSFASGAKAGYQRGLVGGVKSAFANKQSGSTGAVNTAPGTASQPAGITYKQSTPDVTYNQPTPDTVSPDAATDRVTMKTIKTSIQQLPKNQRDQLRQIVAARAKVA
jgi:hypothetical protein